MGRECNGLFLIKRDDCAAIAAPVSDVGGCFRIGSPQYQFKRLDRAIQIVVFCATKLR